ncbi:MAG: DNA repair protein RecN [Pseudomonadota bacterium]
MLRALEIQDILIIDRLELTFQPGLNVLTGETGAGKSILLDALGFVLGWRGRADLVRQGADQGSVVAVFELGPDHPAHAILADADLPLDDELVLRRTNTPDGRKSARVNDRRVSSDVLRQLSEALVELHGQHDYRGLLDAKGHRALLDAYGAHDALLSRTAATWRDWSAALRRMKALQEAVTTARAEEETLRHNAEELATLNPQPGEDAALDAERRRMQAAEALRGDVARAAALLSGDQAEGESTQAALARAIRWLEPIAPDLAGALDAPLAALDRAIAEIDQASEAVNAALHGLEVDPLALERATDRLFSLREAARKFSVLPDDLVDVAAELAQKVAGLDHSAEDLSKAQGAVAEAEVAYTQAAEALSLARSEAAERLDAAVTAELAPLKMDRAEFTTVIREAEPGNTGADTVAFRVATNPGAPAGPLERIASGGELSRFLLALKVCLSSTVPDRTMIFDEIDRGVGGATADAVGRRLAALAGQGGQVLVVTHSPQVAAVGAHHWRVAKEIENDQTRSTVAPLSEIERVDEIARMLSGDRVTDEARAAARALLTPGA